MRRLSDLEYKFPGLMERLYLISCEEAIDDVDCYLSVEKPDAASTEKEHVLVGLKLNIAGRLGIFLLDPGYHIARVITVMGDQLYPHTGWFTQSQDGLNLKEYKYSLTPHHEYVIWLERNTRNNIEKTSINVLYVARPFLAPIEVTERRNLVYNFRSMLARDTKGLLLAGIYFKIEDPIKDSAEGPSCTMMYQYNGKTKRSKILFYEMLKKYRGENLNEEILMCGQQMGLSKKTFDFILTDLSELIADRKFRAELLMINNHINEMSRDN